MKHALFILATAALAAGPCEAAAQQRPAQPPRPDRPEARLEHVVRVFAGVSPGWVGMYFEDGSRGTAGLRVSRVATGSPAEHAGIAAGDTVLRLNGAAFNTAALDRLRLAPGDTARVRVRRNGRERDVSLVAAERPSRFVIVQTPDRTVRLDLDSLQHAVRIRMDTLTRVADGLVVRLDRERVRLDSGVIRLDSLGRVFRIEDGARILRGLDIDSTIFRVFEGDLATGVAIARRALAGAEFSEVNPELGRYFGTERGLLVLRVAPETPAARAGLRAGDVVTRAGGEAVATLPALRRAVQRAENDELRLEVLRDRRRQEVRLRWERPRRTAAR
jgi:S1-C subfamily serine protease